MDYTWPSDIIPNSATLTWLDNSARFVSPFSGVTRTVSRPGGRWRLTMSFHGLPPATAQKLEAFLWRLDGMAHRAVIQDYSYRRQATATGTPIVDGSGQTGRTLLTAGWTADELVMQAGDRFTINDQLLVVAADCYASGGAGVYLLDEEGNILYDEASPQQPILIEQGGAQMFLTHPLRTSPSNGASINITTPTARFILADRFEVGARPGVFKSLQCEFEEAID